MLDVSPLAAEALFGVAAAGWSERRRVEVVEVDGATPLGPCGTALRGDGSRPRLVQPAP